VASTLNTYFCPIDNKQVSDFAFLITDEYQRILGGNFCMLKRIKHLIVRNKNLLIQTDLTHINWKNRIDIEIGKTV